MRRRRGAVVLALGALSYACSTSASSSSSSSSSVQGAAGAVGASIAVIAGSTKVAVVNPDQGSVSFVDPDSLVVLTTTTVGGEPHTLLEVKDGADATLFVANFRGGEMLAIDEASGSVLRRASVCAGPYGLAASSDGSWIAVSCEWDGTVLRIDPSTLTTTTLATGLRRPRAVAIVGTDVYVADYVGGALHDIHEGGTVTQSSLVPTTAPYRPALTQMTANLASALLPAFGTLFVSHVLENNTGDTSLEPIADDYGTVTNTSPKINPAVTTIGSTAPVLYAQFDGGSRVYSGPAALASFGSRYLLVAHVSTANVAVIDTQGTSPDARAVGTFPVGFGPMGIAVDATRTAAFVDNALDQSVSRIDLRQTFAAPATTFATSTTLVRPLPSPYSLAAQAGRRIFFDATNPHVTPSGVVACASCHPGGSDDGLVWFIHTPNIPLKRRRTPHLGNAHTETAPFHWNGEFSTMSDLAENTMTNLMAGDGLLVEVDDIQPFIDEVVKAPLLPVAADDAASVARGETLFHSSTVGCAGCHAGSYLTDDLMHAVLTPMSLSSDDVITTANTPGLHGMFLMAPYFHDGRAETLLDVLTQPYAAHMGNKAGLSSGDIDDLVAYVRSL